MTAINKFAASQVDIPSVIMKVNLGKNASGEFETFEVIAKEREKLSPQEKEAADKVQNKIIKTVLLSFITLCFFNTAFATLSIEIGVDVPMSCAVADTDGNDD